MVWSVDARIPVRFGSLAEAGPDDALLIEGDGAGLPERPAARFTVSRLGHAAGCACCVERSAASLALNLLFQARAKGEIAFFRRVLAVTTTAEAETQLWAALRSDALAAARFRME